MADFQAAIDDFRAEQIQVIAGSVDSVETTRALADKLNITYPIACGMDAQLVSRLTGGFYEQEK